MKTCGFRLKDKQYHFKSAISTYLNSLRALEAQCPDLYQKLGDKFNNKQRGYFVTKLEEMYLRSPELTLIDSNIAELKPGWLTITNLNNKQKEDILIYACHLAGFDFQDDFEIWFSGGKNIYSPMSKLEADRLIEEIFRDKNKP